jgi:hypothetical protein
VAAGGSAGAGTAGNAAVGAAVGAVLACGAGGGATGSGALSAVGRGFSATAARPPTPSATARGDSTVRRTGGGAARPVSVTVRDGGVAFGAGLACCSLGRVTLPGRLKFCSSLGPIALVVGCWLDVAGAVLVL